MSVRFGVDGANSLNQQLSVDRGARRHGIPNTPNFADFSSTGAARLPHLPASGVGLVEGKWYRGSSGDGLTRVDGEVWTISSHHQIDGKLLFCPAEGSPDPRCRREELSRATLKAEAAAAALLSTIGANDPPRVRRQLPRRRSDSDRRDFVSI